MCGLVVAVRPAAGTNVATCLLALVFGEYASKCGSVDDDEVFRFQCEAEGVFRASDGGILREQLVVFREVCMLAWCLFVSPGTPPAQITTLAQSRGDKIDLPASPLCAGKIRRSIRSYPDHLGISEVACKHHHSTTTKYE